MRDNNNGVRARYSDDVDVTGNTIKTNDGWGIHIEDAYNGETDVLNNSISDNVGGGVWLETVLNADVTGNTVTSNQGHGIHVGGEDFSINNNTIKYNQGDGVYGGGQVINISDNGIVGNASGIYLRYSDVISIMANRVDSNATDGVSLYNSEVRTFTNNWMIANGSNGIEVAGSAELVMYEHTPNRNRVRNNGGAEIYVANRSARLYAGWCAYYGKDSIGDDTGKWIYNAAETYDGYEWVSWEVPAKGNYWGNGSSPPTSRFLQGRQYGLLHKL